MSKLTDEEEACISAARRTPGGYAMYAEVQRKIADGLVARGLVRVIDGPTVFGSVVLETETAR